MKSERGVTLTSLIIYVIAMVITVTIITVITSYFYNNVEVETSNYDYLGEFTKFQSNFSSETNLEGNKILEVQNGVNQSYAALTSGNQYTFVKANKSIYKNRVKIASHIENCTFNTELQNGKQVIVVTITVQNTTRTMRFAIRNW